MYLTVEVESWLVVTLEPTKGKNGRFTPRRMQQLKLALICEKVGFRKKRVPLWPPLTISGNGSKTGNSLWDWVQFHSMSIVPSSVPSWRIKKMSERFAAIKGRGIPRRPERESATGVSREVLAKGCV